MKTYQNFKSFEVELLNANEMYSIRGGLMLTYPVDNAHGEKTEDEDPNLG